MVVCATHARRFSHKAKVVIPLSVEKMQALQHSCDSLFVFWFVDKINSDNTPFTTNQSVVARRVLVFVKQRLAKLINKRRLLLRLLTLAERKDGLPGNTHIAEN